MSEINENLIERQYPRKKFEIFWSKGYNLIIFEKFNEMNRNPKFQNIYKKRKNGINYKTNTKIKIGGKKHKKIQKE